MSYNGEDSRVFADLSELAQLRSECELVKKNYCCLQKLAEAAIIEYDCLRQKYDQNQQQYEDVRNKLKEAEDKLASLQNVLEPACNEFNNLSIQLEVERACRSQAEEIATEKSKENNKLKRQSQMLLDKLSSGKIADVASVLDVVAEDETSDSITDNNNSQQQSEVLNQKINLLEKEIQQLESKLIQSETQRAVAVQNEDKANKKCKKMEAELLTVCKRLQEHEQAMESFTRASELAVSEFSELKVRYESQKTLAEAAEQYARQLYRDKEALTRQSTVLMSDVVGDARMMQALLQIEEMTKELEKLKQENQDKTEALEKCMKSDTNVKKISDLEIELELTSNEVLRLQSALSDVNEWKEKLMKQNEELTAKLDEALRPPPPPPPPPPPCPLLPCITSTKLVIQKKPSEPAGGPGSTAKPAGSSKEAIMADAMKEMMDRIQKGLKPSQQPSQRRPSVNVQPPKETHMNELQRLLKKRNEDDDGTRLVSPKSFKSARAIPTSPAASPSSPAPATSSAFHRSSSGAVPPPTLPKRSIVQRDNRTSSVAQRDSRMSNTLSENENMSRISENGGRNVHQADA